MIPKTSTLERTINISFNLVATKQDSDYPAPESIKQESNSFISGYVLVPLKTGLVLFLILLLEVLVWV